MALRVQRRESLPQVGYDGLGSWNGYCVDTRQIALVAWTLCGSMAR